VGEGRKGPNALPGGQFSEHISRKLNSQFFTNEVIDTFGDGY